MKTSFSSLVALSLLFAVFGSSGALLAQSSDDPLATPAAPATLYLPIITNRYVGSAEWTQEAHDSQRTGFSPMEPKEPWRLLWKWNGSDANGAISCPNDDPTRGHCYTAPREARTITSSSAVIVPAGGRGLYALSKTNGSVLWRVTAATFNATPAYSAGFVYAGGADGKLYKISEENGSYETYNAGSTLNRAMLIVGNYVYGLTESGQLHKVYAPTMTQTWVYNAGVSTTTGTGLAYSATRNIVIFGANDLSVHAVYDASGARKWRATPTAYSPGFPNEFRYYWPVVADEAGIVFVRMQLDHNLGLYSYPSSNHAWPNSNAQARSFLAANPQQQNLFALNLDDGSKKFIPAVGYGGVEDSTRTGIPAFLATGPLPVVHTWPDGKQVAYIPFRNGQSNPPDARWDSHMGEMVLDNSTIPGLVPGDLRFVRMARYNDQGGNSYIYITDELGPITMAGSTLFHAHWGTSEAVRITDRSASRGLSYNSPIETDNLPPVVRRMAACNDFNPITHYTLCGLQLLNDGKYWDGPGFWVYWNVMDPPTPAWNYYGDGIRSRYTYVSGSLLIVQGNGGDLMVFRHSGP
jgi:outer membrane protein assembly factor BamB